MELKELSIGDWVMLNNSIYQIEELSKKGWVHLTTNTGIRVPMTTDYIISELQGLPLTKMMLAINGFEDEKENDLFVYKDDFCTITLDMSTWVVDGEEFNPICLVMEGALFDMNISIEYVHELQHALRLCGSDKEIVL